MAVEYVPICVSRDSQGEALVVKYYVPPSGSTIDRVEDELNASTCIRYSNVGSLLNFLDNHPMD